MTDFDFDEWLHLAKSDPEAFEARRKQTIEARINLAPSDQQHRLRGLQWRVDMERKKYKDSLVSCQRVFSMMWNSVYGEAGLLQALNGQLDAKKNKGNNKQSVVRVLDFPATTE